MSAKNKSNKIEITRIYDAPVKIVWDAWVDPDQVAKWWGPRGFTLTTKSKDVRTGGTWLYTMHGPDGTDYPNKTTFLEVIKHSRLVYDHGASETTPPLFRVTVNFTETKGKTKMEMSMAFETPEVAEQMGKFIKIAGGNSTWDRLAEFLAKENSGKEPFVINRSFDAPIALMYEMWTKPEHMKNWLPPGGFTVDFIKTDIKVGSGTFYFMTNGEMKMWGKSKYLELQQPHKIVYEQQFADEKGNASRHPMAPLFPETMLNTIVFTEEGPNQTRLTLTTEAYGTFTKEELDFFIMARSGMTQGWTGSFDALEDYLSK
jgi:uncharacterized protein YndB with AHSA1/START domain